MWISQICFDNVETIKKPTETAEVQNLVAECFVARWGLVVKLVWEIDINNTSMSNVK